MLNQPEERDEAAELEQIKKAVAEVMASIEKGEPEEDDQKELDAIKALLAPLQQQIAALSAKEMAEPKEERSQSPQVINLTVGGSKKSITVKRGPDGAIVGAEVEEDGE